MSCLWRIRADATYSGWAWDVRSLRFFSEAGGRLEPTEACSSGNAGKGFEDFHAVLGDGMWGGRADASGALWIGATFAEAVSVHSIHFEEPSDVHRCSGGVLLELLSSTGWKVVRAVEKEEMEEQDEPLSPLPAPSAPPDLAALVCAASRPLTCAPHDVSLRAALHKPRDQAFFPDESFYHAENCEGLWVCASRACEPEVLHRCCALVRATIPPWQRQLWGQFVAPRWAKDPGPMRIVILDNRSNEQSGCIPELDEGNIGGRNCTNCPFVFTSREDFEEGIAGAWPRGALTAHEMAHGADMVLRQLKDPCFHEDVAALYAEHRPLFRWRKPVVAGGSVLRNCYAAANRDEFLAETHVILLGLMRDREEYQRAGVSTPVELQEQCPSLAVFLGSVFNYPETLSLL